MPKRADPMQLRMSDYQLQEVNVRLCLKEGAVLYSAAPLSNPQAARDVMREALMELDREMVCVVNLDNRMKPINYNVVSIGSIDQSVVPVQNVFKSSILANASAIMLLHNHPSGDVTPSAPDFNVTRRLVEAGKLMDIPVVDHVIVGGMEGQTYCFRENNPDMFSGQPDMEFIKTMNQERGVAETAPVYGGTESMKDMNFEEFKQWAAQEIKDWLPEEYADADVMIHQVEKLGQSYAGMTVKTEDQVAVPTVNLDQFYADYRDGENTDQIMFRMSEIVEKADPQLDTNWLMDYDQVKEKLFIRLSNAETNADILEGAPHMKVADLAITYHIMIDAGNGGVASTMLNNQLMQQYGITPEQLHADAIKSSQEVLPARLDSMQNIMAAIMPSAFGKPDILADEPAPGSTMMVLTNQTGVNGAGALFYPGIMDQAAEHLGGDFFVLPSSTHEVIMIPNDGTANFRDLEQMVQDINRTQVMPEERLSDHVYQYDAAERIFERADEHEMRKLKEKAAEHSSEKKSLLAKLAEKKQEAGELNAGRPVTPHKTAEQSI